MGRLFAEILLLLLTASIGVILWRGVTALLARRREQKAELREARRMAMDALEAGDRVRLNNVIAAYGDLFPKRVRIDLKARSEDLLVDAAIEEDATRHSIRR